MMLTASHILKYLGVHMKAPLSRQKTKTDHDNLPISKHFGRLVTEQAGPEVNETSVDVCSTPHRQSSILGCIRISITVEWVKYLHTFKSRLEIESSHLEAPTPLVMNRHRCDASDIIFSEQALNAWLDTTTCALRSIMTHKKSNCPSDESLPP